jgi:hypothetical protein
MMGLSLGAQIVISLWDMWFGRAKPIAVAAPQTA